MPCCLNLILVFDCKIHQIPGISHLHVSSSCLQPNGQNSAVFIIPARQAAGCMSLKLETPRLRKLAADMIHSSPRDGVYANLDVAVWQVLKRIIDSVFHKRQACFVSKRGANSSSNPNMEEELNEPNMKCTCGLLDDSWRLHRSEVLDFNVWCPCLVWVVIELWFQGPTVPEFRFHSELLASQTNEAPLPRD